MGSGARPDLPLGRHHPHGPAVLHAVQAVDAHAVEARAGRRLLGRLDLGDQVAPRRLPAREVDAGGLADDAAAAVAADEVPRPQRLAAGALDVDAGVVLREAGDLGAVVDAHRQLGDPGGHDPLDVVLEDRERVRVPRREIAHVQHGRAERRDLDGPPLGQEAVGDPALVEHLDRARVHPARPRPGEHVVGTPLDERDVDLGQRQLRGQHHARRAAAGDHHRVLEHARAASRRSRGAAASSRAAGSGRCSRSGSAAGSPGARARPPRTGRPR